MPVFYDLRKDIRFKEGLKEGLEEGEKQGMAEKARISTIREIGRASCRERV